MLKVLKYGGSSMADAAQFAKIKGIVDSDDSRRVVVVSAPGKRHKDDHKVTDLLYTCCDAAHTGSSFEPVLSQIRARLDGIIRDLSLRLCRGRAEALPLLSGKRSPCEHCDYYPICRNAGGTTAEAEGGE